MNLLNKAELAEYKIHEIHTAVEDLTTLAHFPEGASAIAKANLEGIERRLRHLRFDLQAQQAAE